MADKKPLKRDGGITTEFGTGDTLPVANGGTGATTLTSNGVLIGNGTGAITATAEGATGQVLVGVTGGNPVFGKWLPQAVHKTATESVTSSTAFQTDDALTLPVLAGATYEFSIDGYVNATNTGGLKVGMEYPTGTTGYWSFAVGASALVGGTSLPSTGGSSSSMATTFRAAGYIVVDSTAGNLALRWAQNQSNVSASQIYRGSTMKLIRIS